MRFGVSEIRVFEMLEPQEMDLEDPAVTERSKDKKSKAAAQDELKELLARKQEEYKKLQMEKQKNKRQGGKGKKGAGGGGREGCGQGPGRDSARYGEQSLPGAADSDHGGQCGAGERPSGSVHVRLSTNPNPNPNPNPNLP